MGRVVKMMSIVMVGVSTLLVACSAFQAGEIAFWEPGRGQLITEETRSLEILVRERACASGQPAEGRIQRPSIDYREDAVVVTIRVRPRPGGQTCPGNPVTPYTLELSEPLEGRQLLMGTERGELRPDADE